MALFKNLKNKVTTSLPSSLSEKVSVSNISKNISGLTENLSGRFEEITLRFNKIWDKLMSGDFSSLSDFFKQLNKPVEDDGTKKDCMVPNRIEVEDFFWEAGYTPFYKEMALFGQKVFYSEGGKSMFNNFMMLFAKDENLIISFSISSPQFDLPDGLKDTIEECVKVMLSEKFICSTATNEQIIFSKRFVLTEIDEKKEKDLLSQLNLLLEVVSRKIYDHLLPLFNELEEKERQDAQKEARNAGLNASYQQTLDRDLTIRSMQKNFNEDYPYLRMGVFMVKTGHKADTSGGTITPYDSDSTLGKVRSFRGYCKIRIGGDDTPESLEKRFRQQTGLVIKICYNDENNDRFYIGKDSSDHKTAIYDLNEKFRQAGYHVADIS